MFISIDPPDDPLFMRAVIQRVSSASVTANGVYHGEIGKGFVVLLGIEHEDDRSDVEWLADKIRMMRIFQDAEDKMNLALEDVRGQVMIISQFTLHASTRKGNRPSFIKAARPEHAIPLYEYFKSYMVEKTGKAVVSGIFGADMKVALVNDGPVTIIIDSKNKE
jgi:D-tyrosyl-tRNA(Tyr) deacylase